MDESLFELAAAERLRPGDRVVAQMLWGEEECTVVECWRDRGWPMVTVRDSEGAVVALSIARVRAA